MVDEAEIILVIATVASAIFIGITEGLRLTIGYRGSDETRERKQRIDTAIHGEAEKNIEEFLQKTDSPKNKIDEVSNLGYRCYVAQNFTEELLVGVGSFYRKALLIFLAATLFFSMVAIELTTFDPANSGNVIFLLVYGSATAVLYWYFVRYLQNGARLQNTLIKLDEKATLENCMELYEDLVDDGLL